MCGPGDLSHRTPHQMELWSCFSEEPQLQVNELLFLLFFKSDNRLERKDL